MDSFSWSDSLRALTSQCLACLRPPKSEHNDLEDLLADSGSGTVSTPAATTTTADAETLSLHSNPGGAPPRRKRTRFGKGIRLFGWDLFGRRPPIRLPDDDDDEEEEEVVLEEDGGQEQEAGKKRRGHHHHHSRRRPPPPAISTSTLDSDAAPLDSAAIASHATKHAEEAARAARRARRRERKEMKRAALALALEHAAILDNDNAEFEGFPGSGSRRTAAGELPSPHFVRDGASARAAQELRGVADHNDDDEDEDEDDEEGDFDASSYARGASGSSDSGRGSDSRSRTSTSLSLSLSGQQQQAAAYSVQPYNHHYISQQPIAHHPGMPHVRRTNAKNHKMSRSSSSKRSRSSPSASQSPSLGSPVAPAQFSDAAAAAASAAAIPRTAQEFEGFPRGPSLHTGGIERLSSGFPSPGIGGPRNIKRDLGAFLANRGDA